MSRLTDESHTIVEVPQMDLGDDHNRMTAHTSSEMEWALQLRKSLNRRRRTITEFRERCSQHYPAKHFIGTAGCMHNIVNLALEPSAVLDDGPTIVNQSFAVFDDSPRASDNDHHLTMEPLAVQNERMVNLFVDQLAADANNADVCALEFPMDSDNHPNDMADHQDFLDEIGLAMSNNDQYLATEHAKAQNEHMLRQAFPRRRQ